MCIRSNVRHTDVSAKWRRAEKWFLEQVVNYKKCNLLYTVISLNVAWCKDQASAQFKVNVITRLTNTNCITSRIRRWWLNDRTWCTNGGTSEQRCKLEITRSPAVARMADRTAPVVKLTLILAGHNLAKTGTSPLNGPIMKQNEAYWVIFCTLKTTSGFIFLLPVVWSDLATNRKPVGLVSKAIPAQF